MATGTKGHKRLAYFAALLPDFHATLRKCEV
jgi:hypothetical protein